MFFKKINLLAQSGVVILFGHIIISVGVSLLTSDDDNLDAPIGRADEALYKSKNNGRNKTTLIE